MSKALQKLEPKHTNLMAISEIAAELSRIEDSGRELLEQAERAEISDAEAYGKGGALLSMVGARQKDADDLRLKITKPARDFTSIVNDAFKNATSMLGQAKVAIQNKLNRWQAAENARLRREAEERRRAMEEQALKAAAIHQEVGDQKAADTVLELTAQAGEDVIKGAKVSGVRSEFGTTVGTVRTVRGAIEDPLKFLKALVSLNPTPEQIATLIEFKQSGLNTLARRVDAGQASSPEGFRVDVQENARVR